MANHTITMRIFCATVCLTSALASDALAATYTATAVPGAYIDTTATGTIVPGLTNQDDSAANIALPFTFNFFGVNRSSVFASSNGLLTFGASNTAFTNTNLTTSPTQPAIAPFWDDLHTGGGLATSGVRTLTLGAPGSRQFVIDWRDIRFFSGGTAGDTISFQTVLSEGSNSIRFNYSDLVSGTAAGNNGASATVGLRNPGSPGSSLGTPLVLAFNSAPNAFVGSGQSTRVQQGVGGLSAAAVPFAYTDISATGSKIAGLTNADDASVNIALPFGFDLGGIVYNDLFVSSNGLLSFGSPLTTFTNSGLPGSLTIPVIAALWDDLHTAGGAPDSGVYTEVFGAPGSRRFVIEWNEVRFFSGGTAGDTLSFAVELFEDSDDILFSYLDLSSGAAAGNNGASATVGVLPPGNEPAIPPESLLLAFNSGPNAFVGTGQSVLFELTPSGVPEPGSLALATFALAGLLLIFRRRCASSRAAKLA